MRSALTGCLINLLEEEGIQQQITMTNQLIDDPWTIRWFMQTVWPGTVLERLHDASDLLALPSSLNTSSVFLETLQYNLTQKLKKG